MEFLRKLSGFGSGDEHVVDNQYEHDEIFPLHMLDQPRGMGGLMVLSMLFNDQLDANVLRESLSQLIARDDWRRMGGRIKLSVCFIEVRIFSMIFY